MNAPLAIAAVHPLESTPGFAALQTVKKIRPHEWEHCLAFSNCIARADHFLRTRLDGKEVGAIVAEDVGHMKNLISEHYEISKNYIYNWNVGGLRQDNYQTETGFVNVNPVNKIDKVIHDPLFMRKGSCAMLDVADSCAFSIRRWLNEFDYGNDLMYAVFGERYGNTLLNDRTWLDGPASYALVDHEANDFYLDRVAAQRAQPYNVLAHNRRMGR